MVMGKLCAMISLVQPAIALYETIYPLKMHLRYEMMAGTEYRHRGEGYTVSMSRTEIVFEASEKLPIGWQVRLCIDWPVKLQGNINLTFNVYGKTIAGQHTTVLILRHEFRTRAASQGQRGWSISQSMAAQPTV